MKKSLIATGAASLALAAMPVVGVFATPAAINTLTDNIQVTVPSSCSITNANTDPNAAVANLTNNYAKTIYNGQYAVIGSSDSTGSPAADNTIGVTCNSSDATDAAWYITAVGAGVGEHKTQLWDGGSNVINSAATPVTAAGGATSDWSFRVRFTTDENNATIAPASSFSFNAFTQIPATEKQIATGTGTAVEGTFTMDYGVYVSGTQAGGTYNGAVKYTLYNPAS